MRKLSHPLMHDGDTFFDEFWIVNRHSGHWLCDRHASPLSPGDCRQGTCDENDLHRKMIRIKPNDAEKTLQSQACGLHQLLFVALGQPIGHHSRSSLLR